MTTVVKSKAPIVIPPAIQRRAGIKIGDHLEFKVSGRVITVASKTAPSAGDEYTPAQRLVIDARLAKADEDIRQGRTYGPFSTADEMIASMQDELKKRSAARKRQRSR